MIGGFLFYGVFIDMKKFIITEEERRSIRKMYIKEDYDPTAPVEDADRIKTLSIDKNGVATVVLEKFKDRIGHPQNYADQTIKDGQFGITLSVDGRCQKYDEKNQKIAVTYKRQGETLTLPEGCSISFKYGDDGKDAKPKYSRYHYNLNYFCDFGPCKTTRGGSQKPTPQTVSQTQGTVEPEQI